jgi:hypothetical protein
MFRDGRNYRESMVTSPRVSLVAVFTGTFVLEGTVSFVTATGTVILGTNAMLVRNTARLTVAVTTVVRVRTSIITIVVTLGKCSA